MYSVNFNFKSIDKLGEESKIIRQEREKFPSPYYGILHYNNKSGFSLLIKALELPVPLSDPFAETFNTH